MDMENPVDSTQGFLPCARELLKGTGTIMAISKLTTALSSIILLAGVSATSITSAQEYTPGEVMSASEVETGGGTVDIIGIRPGLKCSEALEIATKAFGEDGVKPEQTNFKIGYKGVSVWTPAFTNVFRASRRDDNGAEDLTVHCTGPASGNQVVSLERTVYMGESPLNAPTIEDAKKSLIEKYGPTAGTQGKQMSFMADASLFWVYRNGSKAACDTERSDMRRCYVLSAGYTYDAGSLESHLNTSKEEMGIFVKAEITGFKNDPAKMHRFKVDVVDVPRRKMAAKVDIDSLKAEAGRVHAESNKSGAMPKL